MAEDREPTVRLERWDGDWDGDDPFADLKADVATYAHADPLAALAGLSEASGVPVGALARYVLTRWAAGGAEALLQLGASGVAHLRRVVAEARAAGTDEARLAAFETLATQVDWLAHGLDEAATTYPAGGAGPRRRLRLGVHALVTDDADRLLLTRLSARSGHPGSWTLPGGGLEHGEDPRAGVRREVHEETGLHAEVGGLRDVDAEHEPADGPDGDDVHRVRLLFDATVDVDVAPRVVEHDGTTDAVRWVAREELETLPLIGLAARGAQLLGLLAAPGDAGRAHGAGPAVSG